MRQQLSSPSWKDSTFDVGMGVLTRRTVTESDCAKLDEFVAQSQGRAHRRPPGLDDQRRAGTERVRPLPSMATKTNTASVTLRHSLDRGSSLHTSTII